MERIHVNTEELRALASRLYGIEQNLKGIEQAMDNMTSSSDQIWEGSAKKEAVKDFNKVKVKTAELKEEIVKRASSLQEVAESYDKTEGKSQNIVSNLSVDSIFG